MTSVNLRNTAIRHLKLIKTAGMVLCFLCVQEGIVILKQVRVYACKKSVQLEACAYRKVAMPDLSGFSHSKYPILPTKHARIDHHKNLIRYVLTHLNLRTGI